MSQSSNSPLSQPTGNKDLTPLLALADSGQYSDAILPNIRTTAFSDTSSEPDDNMEQHVGIDMRALSYISPVNEELFCPICHCPFVEPVQTPCRHTFCAECLTKALEFSKSCPIDRQAFPMHPDDDDDFDEMADEQTYREASEAAYKRGMRAIEAAALPIYNMLDNLLVECINKGCKAVVRRGGLKKHVDDECGWTLVDCRAEDCNKLQVMRKDVDKGCLHKMTSCEHCGHELMGVELEVWISSAIFPGTFSCSNVQAEALRRVLQHLQSLRRLRRNLQSSQQPPT
jgi:hypothetical protein